MPTPPEAPAIRTVSPFLEPDLLYEPLVGGGARHGRPGGLLEGQRGGLVRHLLRGERHVLRVASAAVDEDLLALAQIADVLPHALHDSRGLHAEDAGEPPSAEQSLVRLHVPRPHPRSPDADEHLVRTGLRDRHLYEPHPVSVSEPLYGYRAHGLSLSFPGR